ncbi:Ig domain-containing protein [Methylonatrum kenyense]|uniref:Ig domain-containing protein n=1 Tax=Methylonatrum kenyense TaxID=455253 RepID=UPI0020BD550A|nr:Ig domain-containing protein [Methylonatrum kenyense]MCK8516846.1 Ig domain-containing protein [Methylonatrum kenyense]
MQLNKNTLRYVKFGLVGTLMASAAILSGCLGGSSSSGGQDVLQPELRLRVQGLSSPLPVLPQGGNISCGLTPFTQVISVRLDRDGGDGNIPDGTEVQGRVSFSDGGGRAVLGKFNDGDGDDGEIEGDGECAEAFATLPVESAAGRADFLITGLVAGNVTFRAQATVDDVSLSDSTTIRVGQPGSSTPQAYALFGPVPRNVPAGDIASFLLLVVDEEGNRVPNPSGSDTNVRLTIVDDGGFTSDSRLIASDGSNTSELDVQTSNGGVSFSFRAGSQPGIAGIRVQAMDTSGNAPADFIAPAFVYGVTIDDQGDGTGPLLIITTDSDIPNAFESDAYLSALQSQGGVGIRRWEITDGRLPDGLELQPNGVISGTPTETGSFPFSVSVTDENGTGATAGPETLSLQVD